MSKKEVKVPNFPRIYKIVDVSIDGIEKPTGQYRVRRRVQVNGRWTTRLDTVSSFDEAKKLARQRVEPSAPTKKSQIFKEVFINFMRFSEHEKRLSAGTIAGYWNRYRHLTFFEPFAMNQITLKIVDTWIDLLLDPEYRKRQQTSRVCYDHEFALLMTFFRYYKNFVDETFVVPVLDRHRKRTCARPKNSQPEIRFLNTQEEEQFLNALSPWPTIHDLALFQLHTGTRIGEATALEFRNIDFLRGEVRITQHLHWERKRDGKIIVLSGTKSGPTRNVPLTPECAAMLRGRKQSARSTITFADEEGSWLAYRSVQAIYDRTFRRLGLTQTGTHVMRHTFAVRFLDQTKDIYALQQILGHTDLEVTQVYAKYSNESVRRSFQLFRGGLSVNASEHVPQLVPRGGA